MTYNKHETLLTRREFLNTGAYHGLSSVGGLIQKVSYSNGEEIYADFKMSDCRKTIELDLDAETIEDLENSIHKLTQIEKVAREMKELLQVLRPTVIEMQKRREDIIRERNNNKTVD